MVNFAAEVIEQHQLKMTSLSFYGLIGKKKLTASYDRLVQALCESEETQISHLNLGINNSCWNDSSLRASLVEFVKN